MNNQTKTLESNLFDVGVIVLSKCSSIENRAEAIDVDAWFDFIDESKELFGTHPRSDDAKSISTTAEFTAKWLDFAILSESETHSTTTGMRIEK